MTQNQDVYRKVGRGGAGNFYPSKQADEAARDIEAQEEAAAAVPAVPTSKPAASSVSRGGRGGAGNFVDSAASRKEEQDSAAATADALKTTPASTNVQPRTNPLSGRGGAGNWKGGATTDNTTTTHSDGKAEELERKVLEEVEEGLKMPEKVHHAVERKKAP